jgi:hypothetical protein
MTALILSHQTTVRPVSRVLALDVLWLYLHRHLDQAVLTAYAWHQPGPDGPAIDLAHYFQEVETLPDNVNTPPP